MSQSQIIDLTKAVVCGLAFGASAVFHVARVLLLTYDWFLLIKGGPRIVYMGFPIMDFALSSTVLGSILFSMVATTLIKVRILKSKVGNENLTSAFKADNIGDFESGITGTDIYKEYNRDITRFTFMCLGGYYAVTYSLEFVFGLSKASTSVRCLARFVSIVCTSFVIVICGMSCVTNSTMACCIYTKMQKSNGAS